MSTGAPLLRLGKAYRYVADCRDEFLLVEGPRGTAKTTSNLHVLMMRAAQWPGKRWYLWRSTRALLSTTVMPSFEEYVLPAWRGVRGMGLLNPAARATTRTEYVLENGTVFIPVGLDDVQRSTSSEGAGGYLAEAVELENLHQVTSLAGMLRQPGVPFHQIIVDCNPGAVSHFLNRAAEDVPPGLRDVTTVEEYQRLQAYNAAPAANPRQRWKRIVTKIQDNPHFFDVGAWELTEAGRKYTNTLGNLSGYLYRRWVVGEWTNAEGGVFPEFGTANVCEPFKVPGAWPRFNLYDPGHGHPTGITWVALSPAGTLFVYDEIKTPGYALADFGHWIREKEFEHAREARAASLDVQRYADPGGAFSADAKDPRSIAEIMGEEHGVWFDPWPRLSSGKKTQAVEGLRQRVKDHTLKVFSTCKDTIAEFQSWAYKRNAHGEMRDGDDAYQNRDNDLLDGLIGLVALNPTNAVRAVSTTARGMEDEPAETGPEESGGGAWSDSYEGLERVDGRGGD